MQNLRTSFRISRTGIVQLFFVVLLIVGISCASNAQTPTVDDEQVIEFFKTVEDSFIKMRIMDVMKYIHKDFTYVMSYSTDGKASMLESDSNKYRQNLGAFFKDKPDIYEYSIEVKNIERSETETDIKVLARIVSVVELNRMVNACDALSTYTVEYVNEGFMIKGVHGEATCTNKKVN